LKDNKKGTPLNPKPVMQFNFDNVACKGWTDEWHEVSKDTYRYVEQTSVKATDWISKADSAAKECCKEKKRAFEEDVKGKFGCGPFLAHFSSDKIDFVAQKLGGACSANEDDAASDVNSQTMNCAVDVLATVSRSTSFVEFTLDGEAEPQGPGGYVIDEAQPETERLLLNAIESDR
jgi:hypothetical protein